MVCYCLFRGFKCCRRNSGPSMHDIIEQTHELTEYQKNLLKRRYLDTLDEFNVRCSYYSWLFHCSRIIVTVGSLLVPALLSVQYSDSTVINTKSIEVQVYWVTWGISLLVTISNGILTLFKIDKKYYFLHTTFEQLKSEGWQYLELTGRYSGILNKHKRRPTHANQFLYFCYAIEKIKMKQVEEEYFKLSEPTAHAKLSGSPAASSPNQDDKKEQNDLAPPLPSNVFSPQLKSPGSSNNMQLPPIDENVFSENINTDSLTPPEPVSSMAQEYETPQKRRINTLITAMKNGAIGILQSPQDKTSDRISRDKSPQDKSPQDKLPQDKSPQDINLYPPTPKYTPIKRNDSIYIDMSGNDSVVSSKKRSAMLSPIQQSIADSTDNIDYIDSEDDDKNSIHSISP